RDARVAGISPRLLVCRTLPHYAVAIVHCAVAHRPGAGPTLPVLEREADGALERVAAWLGAPLEEWEGAAGDLPPELRPGGRVAASLHDLLTSAFDDPDARRAAVDQILEATGRD